MRTTHVFFFLFLAFICATAFSQTSSLYPKIYPGSIQQYETQKQNFLVKDSYEQVKAFYVKERGSPTNENNVGEKGKTAWFKYVDALPDPGGLRISFATSRNNSVNKAFNRLEEFANHGIISRELFDETKSKYEYLYNYYFVYGKLEDGRGFFMDEIIYRKYNDKMTSQGLNQQEMEKTIAKAQELMMEGKMEEGKALLEKMKDASISGMQDAASPKGAENWIDCLKEMAKNAYPVSISISGM